MKKNFFIIVVMLICMSFVLSGCGEKSSKAELNTPPLSIAFEKMNEEDALLIIRLCYFEMKDEPLIAKTAFCAMILNRLDDNRFPDTVDGVVFEPNAFHSTERKSFYKDINPNEERRDRLALYYALEKDYDPTGGALFCRKKCDFDCCELVPSFTVSDIVFGNPE